MTMCSCHNNIGFKHLCSQWTMDVCFEHCKYQHITITKEIGNCTKLVLVITYSQDAVMNQSYGLFSNYNTVKVLEPVTEAAILLLCLVSASQEIKLLPWRQYGKKSTFIQFCDVPLSTTPPYHVYYLSTLAICQCKLNWVFSNSRTEGKSIWSTQKTHPDKLHRCGTKVGHRRTEMFSENDKQGDICLSLHELQQH